MPLADPAAPVATLQLAPGWRAVDFISDLHLCEGLPGTFAAWADYLGRTSADAVFILGDLFEVWVGDDAATRPFEARCVEVLAMATRRRPIWLLHGNRDFLLGAGFFARTGVTPMDDPMLIEGFGQRIVATHGDALCLDDADYQRFRAQVRSAAWQQAFLARPLDERLAIAAQMRAASREHQRAPVTCADADTELASAWLDDRAASVLVHGHTHRPGTDRPAHWTRHVLSDWDLDASGYAPRAEVLRWTAEGFRRIAPTLA